MRRTKKRRFALLDSQATSPEEMSIRCLEVKVSSSLDSELQETMKTTSKVDVAVEEAEEVEVAEAVVEMTEVHAGRRVVAVVAEEEAKSSLTTISQPSERLASAIAATKVNFKGLDYNSRAF